MLDFDVDLSTAHASIRRTTSVMTKTAVVPEVVETVTVIPASQQAGYKAKDPAIWNWSDLRDYVVREIEDRHGPQVRDHKKEAGIFKGFISRWGAERAVEIAKAAFDVHDGMWRNAPVSVTRFCKGSDPYFSSVIAENL